MKVIIQKPEVTIKELANLLGVTFHRIYEDIRHKILYARKENKHTVIPAEEVKRYLKEYYNIDAELSFDDNSKDAFIIIEDKNNKIENFEPNIKIIIKKLTIPIKQLSELLGISYSAMYKKIYEHNIPCIKIGNRILIKASDVKKFLEDTLNVKCIIDIDLNSENYFEIKTMEVE